MSVDEITVEFVIVDDVKVDARTFDPEMLDDITLDEVTVEPSTVDCTNVLLEVTEFIHTELTAVFPFPAQLPMDTEGRKNC